MNGRIARLVTVLVAAAISSAAWGCGACIEDKVAATYDHVVIKRSIAKRQQVVFVAVEGNVRTDDLMKSVATANVPGLVAGTVRTSADPPAFSFALDANVVPDGAVKSFRKAVRDPHARFTMVRIVRDGRMLEPQ
jgi:hypothetical protein